MGKTQETDSPAVEYVFEPINRMKEMPRVAIEKVKEVQAKREGGDQVRDCFFAVYICKSRHGVFFFIQQKSTCHVLSICESLAFCSIPELNNSFAS
ncbi:hypothetical protein CEXT_562431 [Caerostris extrusa]|uniref:Uncharacterized protein n=1 Tax=Caerostris extrusa TaxID=172846 RepID=A0AAV4P069_CAEEX|nr:hypothetical protein CEXT_562431 [Caerostris extrusa]